LIDSDPCWVQQKKYGELWSTNKKVAGSDVDPPKVDNAHSAFTAKLVNVKILYKQTVQNGQIKYNQLTNNTINNISNYNPGPLIIYIRDYTLYTVSGKKHPRHFRL